MIQRSLPGRTLTLLVLLAAFAAGSAAGAVSDRFYLLRYQRRAELEGHREQEGSGGDRIPTSLYALGLEPGQERRLHEIAERWRPKAAAEITEMRAAVAELENGMFAEMLCALTADQQRRYVARIREGGENARNPHVIERRLRLVESHQCPSDSTAARR